MDDYLIVAETGIIIRILCGGILYLQADGNYTHIIQKGKPKQTCSKALGKFQVELDCKLFCRCHDSYIVNLLEILKYEKARGGYVLLSDGTRVPVSQKKKKHFLAAFCLK